MSICRASIAIAFIVLVAGLSGPAEARPRGPGATRADARIGDNPQLITSRGVGPIQLGMAARELAGRLPVDWTLRWEVQDLGDEGYIHNRLYFVVVRDGEDLLRGDISSAARVTKLTVLSPWFRTPDGLGFGVSFDRLARARGKLACQGTGDFARVEYRRHASARSGNMEFRVCVDLPGRTDCSGPLGDEMLSCRDWLGTTWLRPARGMFEESPIAEGTVSLGSVVIWDRGDPRGTASGAVRSFLSRRCGELGLCKESGACTVHLWEDGCPGCLPGSDTDCAGSAACGELGACARADYRDGVYEYCRPASDGDCRGARRCKSHGECSLDEEGSCAPGTDLHCRGARLCRQEGRCGRDDRGRCAPQSDLHCRASALCREQGRCTLSQGAYSWSRKTCAIARGGPPADLAELETSAPEMVPDGVVEDGAIEVIVEDVREMEVEAAPEPAPKPGFKRRWKRGSKKRSKRRSRRGRR